MLNEWAQFLLLIFRPFYSNVQIIRRSLYSTFTVLYKQTFYEINTQARIRTHANLLQIQQLDTLSHTRAQKATN